MSTKPDIVFKKLFQFEALIIDIIVNELNFAGFNNASIKSVKSLPNEFPALNKIMRKSDLVYQVSLNDISFYIILLLEIQSTVDSAMALRIITYSSLIYQKLLQKKGKNPITKLPTIVPLVIYTGSGNWTAPLNVALTYEQLPEGFEYLTRYHVQNYYEVLTFKELARMANQSDLSNNQSYLKLMAALSEEKDIKATQVKLASLLVKAVTNKDLFTSLKDFATMVVARRYKYDEILAEQYVDKVANKLEGNQMYLAPGNKKEFEQFVKTFDENIRKLEAAEAKGRAEGEAKGKAEGLVEGEARGRAEGEAKGKAEALIKILQTKFGSIGSEMQSKIMRMNIEQLDSLLPKALNAKSIDEII